MIQRSTALKLKLLGLLSLVGAGIASYQSMQFYKIRSGTGSFDSFCNINETMNCNTVMGSRFAELIFGIPLSSVAACAFIALFILSMYAHLDDVRKDSIQGISVLTTISLAFSLLYLGIMVFALRTYCLLCLGVDLTVILSFILAWSIRKEGAGGSLKTAAIIFGISLIFIPALTTFDITQEGPALDSKAIELHSNDWISSPVVPVKSGPEYHGIGPVDAPVTVVEFSDMQCPHCKMGAHLMDALKDRFPGKVRIVLRHYPLDAACNPGMPAGQGHQAACEAARAVYCSAQQGKFEKAYQTIFDRQQEIASGKVLKLLENQGLDLAAMETCMKAESTYIAIQKDIQEGTLHKVGSTPTFFINGHRVNGAFPLPIWISAVEKLLKK